MSIFTSSEIYVFQGLQASRSCVQGKIWWFTWILPYPPFSLPLNCFHLKETELVHSMKIWQRKCHSLKDVLLSLLTKASVLLSTCRWRGKILETLKTCVYWGKVWHSWRAEEERCNNVPEYCTGECIKIESFVLQAPALTCPRDDGAMHGACQLSPRSSFSVRRCYLSTVLKPLRGWKYPWLAFI